MSACAPSGAIPPAPGWRVISACVRGTGHIRAGLPCQDSVYSRADLPGGALVAAVADGAGSAPLSDIGSALAARESVEAARLSMLHTSADISKSYLRATAHASVLIARSALHREARRRGRNVRDFATTLILSISAGDFLATAQIGDGAVVVSDQSGRYSLFTTPQRGEYANVTQFLTSADALDSLELKTGTTDVRRIAMFTDGIQNLVLDAATGVPHAPFFAPLFRWMDSQTDDCGASASLAALLASPKVTRRSDDDVTLLLASASEP